MAGVKRNMSRAESRLMYAKIVSSREATIERQRAEEADRLADPVEQAKNLIRSRGWRVFNESVVKAGSRLIIVGATPRTVDEVLSMAARLRERRA